MDQLQQTESLLLFHPNHSNLVFLDNQRRLASKLRDPCEHSAVFSEEPMRPNRLYEVSMNVVKRHHEVTSFGVVTQHPLLYNPFYEFDVSHPSVVHIAYNGVWTFGNWRKAPREFLRNLPFRSRVGLALTEDRTLHVFLNGVGKGVVARNIPNPCYFMFDLHARCDMIYTLPIKVL